MKRIEYIDGLRGFAIFLMVVGHVIPDLYLNRQITYLIYKLGYMLFICHCSLQSLDTLFIETVK